MRVHVSIHVFYSLKLISHICGFVDDLSIACLGSCVDVCVCGCLERELGGFRGPACCGVAWPSSKALWLLNIYGESSSTQTFQCRPTRYIANTHTSATVAQPSLEESPLTQPVASHFKEVSLTFFNVKCLYTSSVFHFWSPILSYVYYFPYLFSLFIYLFCHQPFFRHV